MYLDLFDVILDLFDRVSIDVVANVNFVLSNYLRPDNWKKTQQPTFMSTVFEGGVSKWNAIVMLILSYIWVGLCLI